ncbi:cilia- and flagella-associated protein 157 [Chrysoperla carnea]|uniref:cilia- and flagella-associated protein 157 n=1 Tax=Chrysoperla carnea TaxID=189513 RepID=UPI001D08195D|nr:cilia- and flagella-associated protein 157 [Chrysoperla carnea]
MGPKKKKGGAGKTKLGEPGSFPTPETNKAFHELTIKDLNQKLARLRQSYNEIENKLTDTQEELKKLDEDRAEIIAFLERTLSAKTTEIAKLTAKIIQMEEERDAVIQIYKDKVIQVEREYKIMRQDLSSKIKLLMGKLNSLEEFRSQRNDLMEKYEIQEKHIEEQEERHKKQLYEAERKFIIGKDLLKKEMENRLLQLSTDFQKATEMRIAATTHRVMRENIALNNEFDLIFSTLQRLEDENGKLKSEDKVLKLSVNLLDEEKRQIFEKANTQDNLIIRLSREHDSMVKKLTVAKDIEKKLEAKQTELYECNKTIGRLKAENSKLEQFVHQVKCDKYNVETEYMNQKVENERIIDIVYCVIHTIHKIMEHKIISNPRKKFRHLLQTLDRIDEEEPARILSMATVSSKVQPYAEDLSYVLLPKVKKHTYVRNVLDKDTSVSSSLTKMAPFVKHEHVERIEEESIEEEPEIDEEEYEQSTISSSDERDLMTNESIDEAVFKSVQEGAAEEEEGYQTTEPADIIDYEVSGEIRSVFDFHSKKSVSTILDRKESE